MLNFLTFRTLIGSGPSLMVKSREDNLEKNCWLHGHLGIGCSWDYKSPQWFLTSMLSCWERSSLYLKCVAISMLMTYNSILYNFCSGCYLKCCLALILEWTKDNRLTRWKSSFLRDPPDKLRDCLPKLDSVTLPLGDQIYNMGIPDCGHDQDNF